MTENRHELRKALEGVIALRSREALRCADATQRRTYNDVFGARR